MVLDKLMFTIGGDDKPAHGSPKPAKKRASKKRKSGSDTPESSIRESTASTVQGELVSKPSIASLTC